MEKENLFSINSLGIVLNRMEAQNIDDLTDWTLAEIKYQYLIQQKHV